MYHAPLSLVLIFSPVAPLFAQAGNADADVVEEADDAFGRRVGAEQIGLYSESNVRGFNLQDAGNYRIADSYFVRSAAPAFPIIAGTTTRVGVNALRYDFPAPSGVVAFDLREPVPGTEASVETGIRANSGPFAELGFSMATRDERLGFVAGAHIYPEQSYVDGAGGDFFGIGITPRWTPSDRFSLTALATKTWWRYDADVGFAVSGPFLPPRIERRVYRGQQWAAFDSETEVAGTIMEAGAPSDWQVRASAFLSQTRYARSDFNLYQVLDEDGAVDATTFIAPPQRFRSLSGEAVLSRAWSAGALSHRIVAMVRGRDTRARTGAGEAVSIGRFDLPSLPPDRSEPDRPTDSSTRDNVEQYTAGIGYRLSIGDTLELRGDVQRTRYRKRVRIAEVSDTSTVSSPWLYSASATLGVTGELTAFASYTRGLEESGIAPANAVNSNDVLPPVLATQLELGARYALDPNLSLIGGAFEISKPVPGLAADGRFDLIGRVRHRGLELSLAGQLTDGLSVVAGLTRLEARLSGELVDSGLIGPIAVGRPEVNAQVNLTWRVPGIESLTFDGSMIFTGPEQGDGANELQTSAFATFNVGLRYGTRIGDTPITIRARVTNLFNRFAWTANSAELLFYNTPRSFALSVAATI